jgi:hypothetical protein
MLRNKFFVFYTFFFWRIDEKQKCQKVCWLDTESKFQMALKKINNNTMLDLTLFENKNNNN